MPHTHPFQQGTIHATRQRHWVTQQQPSQTPAQIQPLPMHLHILRITLTNPTVTWAPAPRHCHTLKQPQSTTHTHRLARAYSHKQIPCAIANSASLVLATCMGWHIGPCRLFTSCQSWGKCPLFTRAHTLVKLFRHTVIHRCFHNTPPACQNLIFLATWLYVLHSYLQHYFASMHCSPWCLRIQHPSTSTCSMVHAWLMMIHQHP